ncbi:MAG: biosynthetic-type acetolactate synthase large subunit [Spirochaetaceae bacterium]|nr:MAG: biosynthetic-type acetolactate synthase large subunit [Spirochaetaceae bacterium]
MKYSGAGLTIELIRRQGIKMIAGIPGGNNLPIYDALHAAHVDNSIRHILVRQEQAGGFIAQGIARTTGNAAVCFATSGPGVTNLLTAIADAKLDSIPMVAVTGQVPQAMIGTDAFQEVDTYGLTIPITKHNFLVHSAAELLSVIPEAFRIAESGRPGPVVVDIPKDVQREIIEVEELPKPWAPVQNASTGTSITTADLEKAAAMIDAAKKPLIYAGGGIISGNAWEILQKFARKTDTPAVFTLLALGSMPADDPLSLGMLGMHGSVATNSVVDEADLLIVCGARFDDRATGTLSGFAPNAKILHMEIDPAEISKLRTPDCAITGDVKDSLTALEKKCRAVKHTEWRNRIEDLKKAHPETVYGDPMHPANLMRTIASCAPKDSIITTDVGQHQMWAAQAYPVNLPRSFLSSGGLGTMGFGFPAAIGAALANPERTVIAICGDGSFLMNIQELATLRELGLDVKIFLFNNGHLGLVRQQQELFYSKNYIASRFDMTPDFTAIAAGFGISSCTMGKFDKDAISNMFVKKGPMLVNMMIDPDKNVMPMVPPGAANTQALTEKGREI